MSADNHTNNTVLQSFLTRYNGFEHCSEVELPDDSHPASLFWAVVETVRRSYKESGYSSALSDFKLSIDMDGTPKLEYRENLGTMRLKAAFFPKDAGVIEFVTQDTDNLRLPLRPRIEWKRGRFTVSLEFTNLSYLVGRYEPAVKTLVGMAKDLLDAGWEMQHPLPLDMSMRDMRTIESMLNGAAPTTGI